MFWFCAINNEISTWFLSKKLRGIINSGMLQGNSNMHSLFSCFMFCLTQLLGCYCKITHIEMGTAGCCGCDMDHSVNFTSSEPSLVIPASHTNLFLLEGLNEWKNEWMPEWETPACLEGGQGHRKPPYPQPRTGTQLLGTPQQGANNAYTSQRVKEKLLELRLKDQRYLPDTLKLL